jgi:hypothetical protein
MVLLRNVFDANPLLVFFPPSVAHVSSPCCADRFLSSEVQPILNCAAVSPRVFRCRVGSLGVICHVLLSCGGERRANGTFYNQRQQDFGSGVVWI